MSQQANQVNCFHLCDILYIMKGQKEVTLNQQDAILRNILILDQLDKRFPALVLLLWQLTGQEIIIIMAGSYWVNSSKSGGVPSTALRAGHDIDKAPIFVGQGFHDGDWLPAKIIPSRKAAYVCYGGQEIPVTNYKVLCEQRFDWVPSADGRVPLHAVVGGKTKDGENLYIGRVHHNGSLTVGKVHPSHRTCYIPFGGKEVGHKRYEILVLRH